MTDLKPCPFCGGKDFRIDRHFDFHDPNYEPTEIVCRGCGTSSGLYTSSEKMVEAWNKRADEMPKWVSVEERLPDKEGEYLWYYHDLHWGNEFIIQSFYPEDGLANSMLTHWMPLLTPPEVEE